MKPKRLNDINESPEIYKIMSADEIASWHVIPSWRSTVQIFFIIVMYSLISAVGVWLDSLAIMPIIWLIQAIILSGFLGAAHDCAHSTMFRSRKINRFAGVIFASIVLFNFSLYKYFHLKHHTKVGTADDTEPGGLFPSLYWYLAALPTHAFFLAFWRMSLEAMRGRYPDFVPHAQARRDVRIDNLVQIGWWVLAVILTGLFPMEILYFYWMPMLLYFPMVFFTSMPEHYACDFSKDIWKNTRSIRSNALFRFVFWNGNFHAEHHIFPGAPSCHLFSIHHRTREYLKHTEKSYILFHMKLIWQLITKPNREVDVAVNPQHRVNFEYKTYREI